MAATAASIAPSLTARTVVRRRRSRAPRHRPSLTKRRGEPTHEFAPMELDARIFSFVTQHPHCGLITPRCMAGSLPASISHSSLSVLRHAAASCVLHRRLAKFFTAMSIRSVASRLGESGGRCPPTLPSPAWASAPLLTSREPPFSSVMLAGSTPRHVRLLPRRSLPFSRVNERPSGASVIILNSESITMYSRLMCL